MYEWLEEIKRQPHKKPFPVLSFPGIQFMDGITVTELVSSSDLQAACMKKVADMTDSAAAVSFMDLSVEAEAFGAQIMFSDDDVPAVHGVMVSSFEEAQALPVPPVYSGRIGVFVDTVRKAKALITDRPVFAGALGPFSLAARLVDVSEAMIYCFTEPEMLHELLEKVTDFSIRYIKELKAAGADGVFLAEPLAGVISPNQEEEFSAPYVKRMVEAVQDENFLVVYHNCGNYAYLQTASISRNGCRAFHFGNSVDMGRIMEQMSPDAVVMGNIDPAGEFRRGTPETMTQAVAELMERCGSYPNFVPSSGCDVPPVSPWENIHAFYKAVNNYYTGKEI